MEGCKCDPSVDSCVARCLETRVLAADCSPQQATATPLYEILVPVIGGFCVLVVVVTLIYRKTRSLKYRLLETSQEGMLQFRFFFVFFFCVLFSFPGHLLICIDCPAFFSF